MARWDYIKDECQKRGITDLGEGGDGDSRILKGSKIKAGLGLETSPEGMEWFKVVTMFVLKTILRM